MLSPRTLWVGLALLLLMPGMTTSAGRSPRKDTNSANALTIAVADFTGSDKELGRFIAETLLTDLAQSNKLNLVERGEIRQALTELKLQSTGLVEPQQVQRLGKLVSADRLIVGSYLARENKIIINARLLDVKSGRLAAGGASNVSGSRDDLLNLTHKLSRLFHRRVTGNDLLLSSEPTEDTQPETREPEPRSEPNTPNDSTADAAEPLPQSVLIPRNAGNNQVVTERDLVNLMNRLTRQVSLQTSNPITTTQPDAPVTRLRALTALVKLVVSSDQMGQYRDIPVDQMPSDLFSIPSWGRPYVAAAIEQGMWKQDQPIKARTAATWVFVRAILSRMAVPEAKTELTARRTETVVERPDPDAYSGLIVDAADLRVGRAMSPRIVDEDGRVVYPDPKYIPDYDYLLDNGMASYCESVRDARRAGRRPLVVRAIDVTGNVNGDLVVTNQAADRIRSANRRGRFLARWAVCFLINEGN